MRTSGSFAADAGAVVGATAGAPAGATVFINEIHYDHVSTDTNEFIELAGPAGTDLSRYRLLAYDKDVLEMVCHVHGDSSVLRQYIGKNVSIRGREYWVENSDMPVVVVGQIVPLAPADVDEPVMF